MTGVQTCALPIFIGNWVDPNPDPVITVHEGYHVVRDDLLSVGSKARAGDYLIGHAPEYANIREWVYGSSPATGYAQISLPFICNRYNKKAVIFMAERAMDKLHEYQKRGIDLGAEYHWVPNGMLPVTQKRAKDFVAQSPDTRALLPIGVEPIADHRLIQRPAFSHGVTVIDGIRSPRRCRLHIDRDGLSYRRLSAI